MSMYTSAGSTLYTHRKRAGLFAYLTGFLMVLLLPAMLWSQTITKPMVVTDCGFNVTTTAVYDPNTDQTTFTWAVYNRNPGNGSGGTFQDLSHWSHKLDQCVNPADLVPNGYSYGEDNSQTCLTGNVVKFDDGTSGGTTAYFTLVLDGHYAPVLVDAVFKAGNNSCCDQIWGVGCCTLALSYTKEDVDCFGGATGSIDLTITGAQGATTTIVWTADNGGAVPVGQANNEDLTGLIAGDYHVTVTDGIGCQETKDIRILQPAAALFVDKAVTDVTCNGFNDGAINLTVSGGTGPYTFDWTDVTTTPEPEDRTGLTAGTYYVRVTDDNGCYVDLTIIVDEPDYALNLTATGYDPTCENLAGGSISGTVSGGTPPYQVSIDNFVTYQTLSSAPYNYTFGSLGAGSYTVKARDANYTSGGAGCIDSEPITLNEPVCNLYGCTPGFWKTHTELWDSWSDAVVVAMPDEHDFITTTNFFSYFGVSTSVLGSDVSAGLTMEGAANLGGGGCKALARHGVAALLNAAQFGAGYPDGYATFNDLYNAIKAALTSGDCATLANTLNIANNTGCPLGNGAVTATDRNIPGEALTSLKIAAYPNPYDNIIQFQFASPVSGKASLEIYDVVGRKLAVVFEGNVDAGMNRDVNYKVPSTLRVPMIYKLTVGDQTSFGRLMPLNRE